MPTDFYTAALIDGAQKPPSPVEPFYITNNNVVRILTSYFYVLVVDEAFAFLSYITYD
jgi:hypothetical protein